MGYYFGNATSQDDLVAAIEAAAAGSGWTVDRSGPVGSGNSLGVESLIHKGDIYVTLRSMASYLGYSNQPQLAGPCVFVRGNKGFDNGQAWNSQPGSWSAASGPYVGTTPYVSNAATTAAIAWPAAYRIFTFTNPDMIVCIFKMTATKYQWITFGKVSKFGTWTGGNFAAASCCPGVATGGFYARYPTFRIDQGSTIRSFAPFHLMIGGFYDGNSQSLTNSRLNIEIPGDTYGADSLVWAGNSTVYDQSGIDPFARIAVANDFVAPVTQRSPNTFNQVGVMTPFWLTSQRPTGRTIVGKLEHVRMIPINNFNPEDVFSLGTDEWMVFPYFEKGGATANFGWAIKANDIP